MRPEEIASEMAAIDQSNRYASDTGELVWDMKNHGLGVVTANTARTKAVIGYAGDRRFDLGGSIVEPKQTMQNGWCAITITTIEGDLPSQLDPQAAGPLRLVITATGYVENTNMGWKNQEKSTVGSDWGTAPSLVEGISARITLPLPSEHVQAWALDERGHRKAQIPTGRSENGSAIILLDPSWHTLWYEVQLTAGLVPTLRP
jgi:hypothetical protein